MPSDWVRKNRQMTDKSCVANPLRNKVRTSSGTNTFAMSGSRNLVQFADVRHCQGTRFPLQLSIDRDIRQSVSHRSHARGYLCLEC
jgi:hypothetical protein